MISARRAALLGLTTPLTAIMVAVLGLWPELEDEPAVSSSGGAPGGRGHRRITWDDLADDDNAEIIKANNQAIVASVVAMVAAGVI